MGNQDRYHTLRVLHPLSLDRRLVGVSCHKHRSMDAVSMMGVVSQLLPEVFANEEIEV